MAILDWFTKRNDSTNDVAKKSIRETFMDDSWDDTMDDSWDNTPENIAVYSQQKNELTPEKVFEVCGNILPVDTLREPDDLDALANKVPEVDADRTARLSLENFISQCDRIEERLEEIAEVAKRDVWSYPESISGTPNLPDEIPQRIMREEPVTGIKPILQKLRGELSRTLANIKVLEDAGREIDTNDLKVMVSAFSSWITCLSPLSVEEANNLKIAVMRIELQSMEVQVSKYRDIAQKCRNVLEDMRTGYHVSRTAYQVALKTADAFFDIYQRNMHFVYSEPVYIDSTDLPKNIRDSLIKAGYQTVGKLASLTAEEILNVSGIGPSKLQLIYDFFTKNHLPALSKDMPDIRSLALTDWRSVNERNQQNPYLWAAPKCYGNMIFRSKMDGVHSSIMVSRWNGSSTWIS